VVLLFSDHGGYFPLPIDLIENSYETAIPGLFMLFSKDIFEKNPLF
jgi:hypothetical protein